MLFYNNIFSLSLCCTGAGTVPGTGTRADTGYGIFQKTKVRVREDNFFYLK